MSATRLQDDAGRSLLERVCRNLTAKCRIGDDRLLVAVSGGSDSVALLRLLLAARPQFNYELVVAHFDHRLRARSADDARFVRALAARFGLDVHFGTWQSPRPAEAAARAARQDFLQRTARNLGCTAVVLGHQLDDQIETVLMRLGRGSGPRGLGGMRWRRRARVDVVRPLLDCRRDELVTYLKRLGQPWCDDASNADLSKTRNRVRHLVLPALDAALGAGWHQRWSTSLEDQRALWTWVRETSEVVLARADRRIPDEPGVGVEVLDLLPLRRLVEPLRRAVLQQWLDPQGRAGLRRSHVVLASDLIRNGQNGQRLSLPGPMLLRIEADKIVLALPEEEPPRTVSRRGHATRAVETSKPPVPKPQRRTGAPTPAHSPAFALKVCAIAPAEALRLLTAQVASPPEARLPPVAYRSPRRATAPEWYPRTAATVLCSDRTSPPFVLRTGEVGERVRLLGAPGSRRLTRILQDRRIPVRLRAAWPVVADRCGIVWIPEIGVAERCRLDESSAQALRFWLRDTAQAQERLAEVHDET